MTRLLLLVCVAFAFAVRHGHWELLADEVRAEQVHLLFALKQQNVDKLETIVRTVSDPTSKRYTDYLTHEELTRLIAPKDETKNAVVDWLLKNGVSKGDVKFLRTNDVIQTKMNVFDADRLFDIELRVWRGDNGRYITRSKKTYTMPKELVGHVDLIHGLSDFTLARKRDKKQSLSSSKNFEAKRAAVPVDDVVVESTAVAAGPIPVISGVGARGSPPTLHVMIELVCPNGAIPTSLPICGSSSALSQIQLLGVPLTGGANLTNAVSYANTATMPPGCSQHENAPFGIHCSVTLPNVPFYTPIVNITATTVFRNGARLVSNPNPFEAVATPEVTPQSIRSLYKIPPHAFVTSGATQAVAEFEQQYYSDDDLRQFFIAFGLSSSLADDVVVVGPNNQTLPGGEADLDIQYLMAIAPGAETWFWSIGANSTVEIDDILKWAYAMGNATNPPMVTSISYGMSENLVDIYLGSGYLKRSDYEFMKLAALGLTVIIASGDTGAGDLGPLPMSNPTCLTMHPDWPSQSPYVTSIGSTYFTPNDVPGCYNVIDCSKDPIGEVSVSLENGLFWTTGGGFSNITKRAWFQTQAVQDYLNSDADFPPSFAFNVNGRAYPDAVAVGHNLMVVLNGTFIPIDGTSASAPVFAGVITLLNDARLLAGKKPLGLLNPMLYKVFETTPSAFYDVTVGSNRCGAYLEGSTPSIPTCCQWGYSATPGFDTTGGLGSPQFDELRRAVLAL